jgi:hypothetical protein
MDKLTLRRLPPGWIELTGTGHCTVVRFNADHIVTVDGYDRYTRLTLTTHELRDVTETSDQVMDLISRAWDILDEGGA